jgi:hypothetical protein
VCLQGGEAEKSEVGARAAARQRLLRNIALSAGAMPPGRTWDFVRPVQRSRQCAAAAIARLL